MNTKRPLRGERNYILLPQYRNKRTPLENDMETKQIHMTVEPDPRDRILLEQRDTIHGLFKSVIGLSSVIVGIATGAAVGAYALKSKQ